MGLPMATPKVSVVMPVYNGQRYLRQVIDSILNQTFKDFEFIIINDGSTDSTKKILEGYFDRRIVIIENQQNLGFTKSLNRGLKRARGEYIARQDADDISLPERLEKMVDFLDKNKDVGLLGASFIKIDEDGKEYETCLLDTEDEQIRKRLLVDKHFGHEMYRKICIEKVGFYRDVLYPCEDYDLNLRIAEKFKVANIREPLYKYRSSLGLPSMIMGNYVLADKYREFVRELARERGAKGIDRLDYLSRDEIKKILPKLTFRDHLKLRRLMSGGHYKKAIRLLKNGEKKISLRYIYKSIINNPFHYYAWVFLIENFISRGLVKILRKAKRKAKVQSV